jgi:hypothetical protein
VPNKRHPYVLSIAEYAHQMTWCCIQKLCINSGEGHYHYFLAMPIICIGLFDRDVSMCHIP